MPGFTTNMYDMAAKVVKPAITSVFIVVPWAWSLKRRSISGEDIDILFIVVVYESVLSEHKQKTDHLVNELVRDLLDSVSNNKKRSFIEMNVIINPFIVAYFGTDAGRIAPKW